MFFFLLFICLGFLRQGASKQRILDEVPFSLRQRSVQRRGSGTRHGATGRGTGASGLELQVYPDFAQVWIRWTFQVLICCYIARLLKFLGTVAIIYPPSLQSPHYVGMAEKRLESSIDRGWSLLPCFYSGRVGSCVSRPSWFDPTFHQVGSLAGGSCNGRICSFAGILGWHQFLLKPYNIYIYIERDII